MLQAGEGSSGGEPPVSDCGDDSSFVHVPLDCACPAGLCTTLAEDLQEYVDGPFGWPYFVLRGTCAAGYQVLSYSEACENGGAGGASGESCIDRDLAMYEPCEP